MNLSNFEEYINQVIVERGYDYYLDDNVLEITEEDTNKYCIIVGGSNDYEVEIILDNKNNIIHSECDCPYDFGPICKHEVAAFYKLRDIKSSKKSTRKANKNQLKEILLELSKDDLVNIILDIVKKNKTIKENLLIKYSNDPENSIKQCEKYIASLTRKYMKNRGFVEYRDVRYLVNEMDILLDKVIDIYEVKKDYLLAVNMALYLMQEGVFAYQFVDDSDGYMANFVQNIIDIICRIIYILKNEDIVIKEKVFHILIEISDSKAFDGWEDYSIILISFAEELADNDILIEKLKIHIKECITANEAKNSYSSKYYTEKLLQILYNIVDTYCSEEEKVKFINENIKYSSFRDILIEKNIKEKNYENVIEITKAGEKADSEYAGLVFKWKEKRYEAYKALNNKEEQIKLLYEFIIDGNFQYYNELKEIAGDGFDKYYIKIKKEFKSQKYFYNDYTYLKIIEAENDVDEILYIVKKHPELVERYKDILWDKYKEEVINIYIKSIYAYANNASNRKQYREVCKFINRSREVLEDKETKKIINELLILNKNRRAFLEELRSIIK